MPTPVLSRAGTTALAVASAACVAPEAVSPDAADAKLRCSTSGRTATSTPEARASTRAAFAGRHRRGHPRRLGRSYRSEPCRDSGLAVDGDTVSWRSQGLAQSYTLDGAAR